MVIDFDGIQKRVARVPVGAENYGGLSAKAGHILYGIGPAFYYGRSGDRPAVLKIYSLKDRKETTLAEDVRGYSLSDDGSKVLVAQGPAYNVYDATPQGDKTKKTISTAGLMVDRVPAEEWNQIFNEVWRRYRDWFYVTNMYTATIGLLREQYKPLLQYVAHRSDLNYVISEMISVNHSTRTSKAEISRSAASALWISRCALRTRQASQGRYRIAKIFAGENEDIYRSPLREIGVNANVAATTHWQSMAKN